MSDISQIQVNGTTYDLCDATSRTQIANLQDSVNRFDLDTIKKISFWYTETQSTPRIDITIKNNVNDEYKLRIRTGESSLALQMFKNETEIWRVARG